jgi:hypothetical protein
MNDSPFSYDMLKSLAVQVSQELYRETLAESAPSEPLFSAALADLRPRLAALGHRFQMSGTPLSHAATGTIKQAQS